MASHRALVIPPIIAQAGEPIDLEASGVYHLYDKTGALLYVGRTTQLRQRMMSHRSTQPWWREVAYMQWVVVDNYADAVALERDSIERDHPRYNAASTVPIDCKEVLPEAEQDALVRLYAASERGVSAELDSYMLALHDNGWRLATIGQALGITRERVRQRIAVAERRADLAVAARPKQVRKDTRKVKVWPTIPADTLTEMQALAPLARHAYGSSPLDSPERAASVRLTELIAELRLAGVRYREIDDALGFKLGTSRSRLARHGYVKRPPSLPAYRGVRNQGRTREQCHKGHPLSGENLRLINGDPKRRVCRECDRARVAAYLARKAAA